MCPGARHSPSHSGYCLGRPVVRTWGVYTGLLRSRRSFYRSGALPDTSWTRRGESLQSLGAWVATCEVRVLPSGFSWKVRWWIGGERGFQDTWYGWGIESIELGRKHFMDLSNQRKSLI